MSVDKMAASPELAACQKAAEQGDALAQLKPGRMYCAGTELPKNSMRAEVRKPVRQSPAHIE